MAVGSVTAMAADCPVKPIRLIVVYGAGGANDIVARLIGAKLSESLGQPVLVENKPGAGGMIGAKYVATSPPDRYTLLVGGAALVVSPALYNTPLVNALKDFAPVGRMVDLPVMLVSGKDFPPNNVKELVAYAKAKSEAVSMAVTAPSYMFFTERMNFMAGISLLRVPYTGVATAMTDVPTGRVSLLIDTVAAQMPFIKSARTKALGVFTAERVAGLPEVPTLDESGFKGFIDSPFIGLLAPTGTSEASSLETQVAELLQRCPQLAGAVSIDQDVGKLPSLDSWMAGHTVNVEQEPGTLVRIASSAQQSGVTRLLQKPRSNSGCDPKRLAFDGRRRLQGRGGLSVYRRPQARPDHQRRIQHISGGDRTGALVASGRQGLCRDRRT